MNKTRQKNVTQTKVRIGALHLILALVVLFLPVRRALAQPWFLPTEGVDSVILTNTSAQPQTVWVDAPNNPQAPVAEMGVAIPANQSVSVNLSAFKNQTWFQIKSYSQVPITASATLKGQVTSVASGRSDTLEVQGGREDSAGFIELVNLSPNDQEVVVQESTEGGEIIVPLKGFDRVQLPQLLEAQQSYRILGQYPLAASFLSSQYSASAVPIVSEQKFKPDPSETYFLMANSSHTQSFVFHSHDPNLIAQARSQLSNLPERQRKIFVGKVGFGHDNNNRDLIGPTHNSWSWNVTEAIKFGDLGSQSCDGNPALVEDNIKSWLAAPGGICFWNYKLIQELSLDQVASGSL